MSRTVRVEGIGGRGRGVTHVGGDVCFVAGALPGETVRISDPERRGGVLEARMLGLEGSPHPARDPNPCPHTDRCGGCDWSHVLPEDGVTLKREVAAAAARFRPDLADRLRSAPITPSPLEYRLRARLHWDPDRSLLGFYRRRSWEVTPIAGCRLLSPRLLDALDELAAALAPRLQRPADLEWLEDLDGAVAVAALRPARGHPQAIDDGSIPPTPVVGGPVDGWHRLAQSGRLQSGWGAHAVTMTLPVPLEVPVGAFFQVNRHLIPEIFRRIAGLSVPADLPVWDLHAGVGLLAAAASTAGERSLTLVEPFRPAAHAAARNLPEARVAAGRTAEAYLARHRRLPREAVVLTDPPRAGMTPTLRHQLAGWHPARIVSMACDAATWARDTAFLIEHGYVLRHVELLDLFPSTSHVEVLSVLEAL